MMKRRATIFIGLSIGLLSMSSEIGVAEDQNRDRTGTPDGSDPCSACHNGGAFNAFMNIDIEDSEGNDVDSYVPGAIYSINYTLTSFGGPPPQAYGFQSTALFDDLSNAGSFQNPSSNTQLEEVDNTTISSRHMVEHSVPSPIGIFGFEWVAPMDTSQVTFYYAGNICNGDGDSSGDNSITGTFTMSSSSPTGLNEYDLDDIELFRQYDGLWLRSSRHGSVDRLDIYDLSGRLVHTDRVLTLPHRVETIKGVSIIHISVEGKSKSWKSAL